jgi:hypothetical protein
MQLRASCSGTEHAFCCSSLLRSSVQRVGRVGVFVALRGCALIFSEQFFWGRSSRDLPSKTWMPLFFIFYLR